MRRHSACILNKQECRRCLFGCCTAAMHEGVHQCSYLSSGARCLWLRPPARLLLQTGSGWPRPPSHLSLDCKSPQPAANAVQTLQQHTGLVHKSKVSLDRARTAIALQQLLARRKQPEQAYPYNKTRALQHCLRRYAVEQSVTIHTCCLRLVLSSHQPMSGRRAL